MFGISDRLGVRARLVWMPDNGAGDQGSTGTPGQQTGQAPDQGQQTPPTGGAGAQGQPPQLVDVNATDEHGHRLWFDASTVRELRQEAATYRTQLQEVRRELEALRQPDPGAGQQTPPTGGAGQPTPPQGGGAIQERIQKLEADLNRRLVENAVLAEAARADGERKRFINPADAVALADLSKVKLGADGTVTGVSEALKALAESRPHLLEAGATGHGAVTPTNPARETPLTLDDVKKMTPAQVEARWDEVQAVLKGAGA